MANTQKVIYDRLHQYAKKKTFENLVIKAADNDSAVDESTTLVNNLSSISGQCNNLIDTLSQIEAAKKAKDGDAMDKALDTLKLQINEYGAVEKMVKAGFLAYLKPMVKQ